MNTVVVPQRRRWSSIKANHLCVSMKTHSGYRRSIADEKGKEYLFSSDVGDVDIGNALLDCLAHSRFVIPEFWTDVDLPDFTEVELDLYDYKKISERYKAWVDRLMDFTGCKSKAKLFKPMYSVSVEELDGVITLSPSRQEKPEAWGGDGMQGVENVVISANSSPEEIGKAVRLALSRCLSNLQNLGTPKP